MSGAHEDCEAPTAYVLSDRSSTVAFMTSLATYNTVFPTPSTQGQAEVVVGLQWDGDGDAVRRLRLPDGAVLTLTDGQFDALRGSVERSSKDHCVQLAMAERRKFSTPEVHGLALLNSALLGHRMCWQVPSLPNGPVIAFNDTQQAWDLTVLELGRNAFSFPLVSVPWDDVQGMKDLAAMAHDPDSALMLAALAFPAELAAASLALAQQREWDELKTATQVLVSLVKSRANKFLVQGDTLGGSLVYKQVGVRRRTLGLSAADGTYGEAVGAGVEVMLFHAQPMSAMLIRWVREAMVGGRIALSVVQHGERVFVTRNTEFLMTALTNNTLLSLKGNAW